MIAPGVAPPGERVNWLQNWLGTVGWSTHSDATVLGSTWLIAPLRLMSYQSTDAVKPRRKPGRSRTPAVQVVARSGRRLGLPVAVPTMKLGFCRLDCDVPPTAASVARQLAFRYGVPLLICSGVQGSVMKADVPSGGGNSSLRLGARTALP